MFSLTDQSSGGNLRFPSASLFLEPFVLFSEEESSATMNTYSSISYNRNRKQANVQ